MLSLWTQNIGSANSNLEFTYLTDWWIFIASIQNNLVSWEKCEFLGSVFWVCVPILSLWNQNAVHKLNSSHSETQTLNSMQIKRYPLFCPKSENRQNKCQTILVQTANAQILALLENKFCPKKNSIYTHVGLKISFGQIVFKTVEMLTFISRTFIFWKYSLHNFWQNGGREIKWIR